MIGVGISPTRQGLNPTPLLTGNGAYKSKGTTPQLVWDFEQAYQSHPLPDLTRSGLASYIDLDGKMQIANANEKRFDYSTGQRSLLIEDEGENICTSPTVPALDGSIYVTGGAVLSVQDRTTDLSSLGLDHVTNGLVLSVDNSAGSQYCFCVIRGASAQGTPHLASAYARLLSGPGGQSAVRIDGAAANQSANITSPTFALYETMDSTPANSQRMLLRVAAGNIIEFCLPFYRPSTQTGGYVPNEGGSRGTRGADLLTITGDSYGLASDQRLFFETPTSTFTSQMVDGKHTLTAGNYSLIQDWYA